MMTQIYNNTAPVALPNLNAPLSVLKYSDVLKGASSYGFGLYKLKEMKKLKKTIYDIFANIASFKSDGATVLYISS